MSAIKLEEYSKNFLVAEYYKLKRNYFSELLPTERFSFINNLREVCGGLITDDLESIFNLIEKCKYSIDEDNFLEKISDLVFGSRDLNYFDDLHHDERAKLYISYAKFCFNKGGNTPIERLIAYKKSFEELFSPCGGFWEWSMGLADVAVSSSVDIEDIKDFTYETLHKAYYHKLDCEIVENVRLKTPDRNADY